MAALAHVESSVAVTWLASSGTYVTKSLMEFFFCGHKFSRYTVPLYMGIHILVLSWILFEYNSIYNVHISVPHCVLPVHVLCINALS